MKKFKITFIVIYEGYNGYDHKTDFTYDVVARNSKSAINKAKKLLKKNGGGYIQNGYVRNTIVE